MTIYAKYHKLNFTKFWEVQFYYLNNLGFRVIFKKAAKLHFLTEQQGIQSHTSIMVT